MKNGTKMATRKNPAKFQNGSLFRMNKYEAIPAIVWEAIIKVGFIMEPMFMVIVRDAPPQTGTSILI